MSPYHHATIRAQAPWADSQFAAEKEYGTPAPRHEVWFTCQRGCRFTVPFAATADPVHGWDCKCGSPALADGAPEDAEPGMAESKHGSGLGGVPKGCGSGKYGDVTPIGQLRKRRTDKEGAELLAEALAARQQQREVAL